MNATIPTSDARNTEPTSAGGNGAPQVLLLHGFTGSSQSWSAVAQQLQKHVPHPIELFAPSLLGHAPSDLPALSNARTFSGAAAVPCAPTAFVQHADAVLDWAIAKGFRAGVVCGYSLGGRIAIDLLTRHTVRATAAVVISSTAGVQDPATRRERARADAKQAEMLRRQGLAAFIEYWNQLPLFSSQRRLPRAVRDTQQRLRATHHADGLATSLEQLGLAQMPNCWPLLSKVRCPVRVVTGELDAKFTQIGKRLVQSLPNAEHRRLRGVGHNPLLETPETVASEIATSLCCGD